MPRQRPSEHGRILGAALARIADEMEPKCPMVPDRCKTCAFREGTIPNQMAGTLAQALDCVVGEDPNSFFCHHYLSAEGEPTRLCAGYVLLRKVPFERVKAELVAVLADLDQLKPTEQE